MARYLFEDDFIIFLLSIMYSTHLERYGFSLITKRGEVDKLLRRFSTSNYACLFELGVNNSAVRREFSKLCKNASLKWINCLKLLPYGEGIVLLRVLRTVFQLFSVHLNIIPV